MKKIVALVVTLILATPVLFAEGGKHPMAGCGLGYVLFGHSDNSKIMQVFAATTNEWGTQTFGISSGTSGCTEDGAVKFVKAAEVYAEVNLHSLREEMAKGQGEYLSTFASMLVKDSSKVSTMAGFLHDNYGTLFPSADVSSADFLSTLQTQLSQHPDLLS